MQQIAPLTVDKELRARGFLPTLNSTPSGRLWRRRDGRVILVPEPGRTTGLYPGTVIQWLLAQVDALPNDPPPQRTAPA